MERIKAQSEVISTVLLILLVIVSIMVVFSIVYPFINKNLQGSECFKVIDEVTIKNSAYTCYNSASNSLSVQVHFGDNSSIYGFQIVVESGGSSSSAEVNGTSGSLNVVMYSGGALNLPGKNEERTYNITGINSYPDQISIYPILTNGQYCSSAPNIINSIDTCS